MNTAEVCSPMNMSFAAGLLPEDIQELLGVVEGESGEHGGHGEHKQAQLTSSEGVPSAHGQPAPEGQTGHSHPGAFQGKTLVIKEDASDNSGANEAECDEKAQLRSERKRTREKKRRSDVNKQFADLTQLLQKIDAEDCEGAEGSAVSRVTFNPSNRVDLIARTICLLERLHDSNKKRKVEIESLGEQVEEAKKAGEDTAARLKEALVFNPMANNSQKQVMMMVPMMMPSDHMNGAGQTAMPMMPPFMPQPYCPMPPHTQVSSAAVADVQAKSHAPSQMAATTLQPAYPYQAQPAMSYVVSGQMPGAYMMPMSQVPDGNVVASASMNNNAATGMAQVTQHGGVASLPQQQSNTQGSKDSSNHGGGNLAHCA